MKNCEAVCLLDKALNVANTRAIKNNDVKRLLNAIMIYALNVEDESEDESDELVKKLTDKIYNKLKDEQFYEGVR